MLELRLTKISSLVTPDEQELIILGLHFIRKIAKSTRFVRIRLQHVRESPKEKEFSHSFYGK